MANPRFNGHVTHAGRGSLGNWYADMPMGFGPDYVRFWDDFTGIAVDSTNAWTVVKDSSATVAIVADTMGGEIALTSATTTDDDGASIQGNEVFLPAAGRTIWFEARIKIADATEQDLFVGLCENFATNPEAALAASNRIGFQKNDGSTLFLTKTEVADTETSTTTEIAAAAATYVTLGFKVNGVGSVEFYINRNRVATHTTVPATELAPAIFHLSGVNTGTKSLTADYVLVVATR